VRLLSVAPSTQTLRSLRPKAEEIEITAEPYEHAFVSIKGRDYTWFRAALERGDLATVRSTLVDLPPLTLEDVAALRTRS
jgi:hypothetical protein